MHLVDIIWYNVSTRLLNQRYLPLLLFLSRVLYVLTLPSFRIHHMHPQIPRDKNNISIIVPEQCENVWRDENKMNCGAKINNGK